jgi:hypothetical protein
MVTHEQTIKITASHGISRWQAGSATDFPKLKVRVRACSLAYRTYVESSAAIDRGHERHSRSQCKDQPEPWRSVKPPVEPELRR